MSLKHFTVDSFVSRGAEVFYCDNFNPEKIGKLMFGEFVITHQIFQHSPPPPQRFPLCSTLCTIRIVGSWF